MNPRLKLLTAALFSLCWLCAPAQAQMKMFVVASCPGSDSINSTSSLLGPWTAVDIHGTMCTNSSGGGGGGLSVTDEASFTAGTSSFTPGGGVFNDSAALTSGQQGTFRLTTKRAQIIDVDSSGSQLHSDLTAAIPTGTNPIGSVLPSPNQSPTDCSGTIGTGGTSQTAISAQTTLHTFTIMNIDPSTGSGEPLWIAFTGSAAAAATAGSYVLQAPTATTFANPGSITISVGTNHAVFIIGATTGHKYSCTWW